MHLVTKDEADELVEHCASRSDIWILHNGVWIRLDSKASIEDCPTCKASVLECLTCKGSGKVRKRTFALALTVRNGLPDDFYSVTHKALLWSEATTTDYVRWLLEKYTAYALRQNVQRVLKAHKVPELELDVVGRELCQLYGGQFVRKHGDMRAQSVYVSSA